MGDPVEEPAVETRVFFTPPEQRWADTGLSLLLVALLMLPLFLLGRHVYVGCLVLAATGVLVALRYRVGWCAPWKLVVEASHLRMGRRRIALRDINFLGVSAVEHTTRSTNVAFTVSGRGWSRRRIWLRRSDADEALAVVHARSAGASAVDSTGRRHEARLPEARIVRSSRSAPR